jgi:hypothetical protein
MPYSVSKDAEACPASRPWAVKNQQTGKLHGCHPTKEAAKKQQAALYVHVPDARLAENPDMNEREEQDRSGEMEARQRKADLVRAIGPGTSSLRDSDDGMPTLTGRFGSFGEWAEINNKLEGHFMERISPTAFEKTIQENRDNIRVLFHHGLDPSIGNKVLGPIQELRGDTYYEVPLLDTTYNHDLLPGLRAGLYGASFKFGVVKEEFDPRPTRSDHNPSGLPESTVMELRLREFGPTPFPAYAGASAGVRSLTDEVALAALVGEQLITAPEGLRQLFDRAAALSEEPDDTEAETSAATTPSTESRRTQPSHDYLEGKEDKPSWQL